MDIKKTLIEIGLAALLGLGIGSMILYGILNDTRWEEEQ